MINALLWHSARHTFASLGTHSRRPDNKYDRRNFILEPPLLLLFLCRGWGGILSISVCCIHTWDTKNHQLYEYEDTYFTVTPGDGGRKKAEREENSLNVISVFHLCNYQRKASGKGGAQNVRGVQILGHRTDLLCESCQTTLLHEILAISLKIAKLKCAKIKCR